MLAPPMSTVRLVRNVASDQALLDALCETGGDVLLELGKVGAVDLLGEAEGGVDNVLVQVDDEVLGDGAGAGVLGVQARDGHGGLAVQVLLEVDAALGENGALELGEGRVELGRQAVLEHEAGEDVAVGRDGQELGRARVHVRGVEAAGFEEDAGRRDAQARQDREVGARREVDLSALAGHDGRVGGRIEVEFEADVACRDLLLDVLEPSHRVVGREELGDDATGGYRVGRGGRVAQHARGVAGAAVGHVAGRHGVLGRRGGRALAGGSTAVPATTTTGRGAHG